jgi:hypothetical protein
VFANTLRARRVTARGFCAASVFLNSGCLDLPALDGFSWCLELKDWARTLQFAVHLCYTAVLSCFTFLQFVAWSCRVPCAVEKELNLDRIVQSQRALHFDPTAPLPSPACGGPFRAVARLAPAAVCRRGASGVVSCRAVSWCARAAALAAAVSAAVACCLRGLSREGSRLAAAVFAAGRPCGAPRPPLGLG